MPTPASRLLGVATIATAFAFNAAFARLAATFDYPDILRAPAGEVLDAFAAGGAPLVLTWYAFALSALAMIPVALGLSLFPSVSGGLTPLRVSAAILGALAGTVQAVGLLRWVFAVPLLASATGDPETAFLVLNQWGGVAIGEHMGYLMTAGFLVSMALAERAEGARLRPLLGAVSAALILVGAGEGLALILGRNAEVFAAASVAGYLGFSAWLAISGVVLIRGGNEKGRPKAPFPDR
jgi:hypothetical protein